MSTTEEALVIDATLGNVIVNLVAAALYEGAGLWVCRIDNSPHSVLLVAADAGVQDYINGSVAYPVYQEYQAFVLKPYAEPGWVVF